MSEQLPEIHCQPVDQKTFEEEMKIRLMPEALQHLGIYIVRLIMDLREEPPFFAIDSEVQIAKIVKLQGRLNLGLSLFDTDGNIVITDTKVLTSDGFFMLNNSPPQRLPTMPEGLIPAGYFVRDISEHIAPDELVEYFGGLRAQARDAELPDLVSV